MEHGVSQKKEVDGHMLEYDVLISGAGMVGAALGCALGQAGMKVALVDPAEPQPFIKGAVPDIRVSALSPASEQFLDSLGAWAHIKEMRLCPYRKMAVWEKLQNPITGKPLSSRFNQTLFDCNDINEQQLGHIVENNITQLGLHQVMESLNTVDVISPARPNSLSFIGGQPQLTLDNGSTLTGKLLIGADGANSFVRQSSSIGLSSSDYEQGALVATVEIPEALDITWQAFTPTGPLALLPLPCSGGKSYASLVWYNLPENIRSLISLSSEAFLAQVRSHFPEELPELLGLETKGSFPLTRRHASTYYKEGVVLVGDAAHTINPLAGQGVNLGFQDAACLAEVLVKEWKTNRQLGAVNVLNSYEEKRRPDNARMQMVMDVFYHTFSTSLLPLKVLRNIGLSAAGKFTPGKKQVMQYAMGVSKPSLWPLSMTK